MMIALGDFDFLTHTVSVDGAGRIALKINCRDDFAFTSELGRCLALGSKRRKRRCEQGQEKTSGSQIGVGKGLQNCGDRCRILPLTRLFHNGFSAAGVQQY